MDTRKSFQILAISGSLKVSSLNTAILRALVNMAPENVLIKVYDELETIPPFSPDRDGDNSPGPVKKFRLLLKNMNGVIICTPEYAFGVPGILKNLLDWTVSTGEFNEKPVSAISASPLLTGGDKAMDSLLLTLTALGTIKSSHLCIPSANKKLNDKKEVSDPETLLKLNMVLDQLIDTIKNYKPQY